MAPLAGEQPGPVQLLKAGALALPVASLDAGQLCGAGLRSWEPLSALK